MQRLLLRKDKDHLIQKKINNTLSRDIVVMKYSKSILFMQYE